MFRRRAFGRLVVSYDQLFLLILFYAATLFVGSYFTLNKPQFTVWGLGYLGADLLTVLLAGYLLAKVAGDWRRLPLFMVISYSIAPFVYAISGSLVYLLPPDIYMGIYAWFVGVMFFITYSLLDRHKLKTLVVTALWFVILLPMTEMAPGFWYEGQVTANDSSANEHIDGEKVFYSQYDLLRKALNPIHPGVSGVDDLFFVGFGSFSSQDVFMKEIGHIQAIADRKMGTRNRSVVLINNRQTLNDIPLASATNLGLTLGRLGKLMNQDEDVLLLYLTSHGSREHTLAVDMYPLGLNDMTPQVLKQQLDDAGIRWRIILVSACYSGGFIEPLKDEYSLILTASAQDKTSFGCANENEFTYFGEALFKDVPDGAYEFIPGFERAIASIEQREKDEGLEASEPQMYVGALIKEKLDQLERAMKGYPPERYQ